MQFAIELFGKHLLDDAVFFRIKEQLLISLRIFHISLLCGCVKDTVLLLITFAVACILSEAYRAITKYDNRSIHMAISLILFCYGMFGSPLAIWVYKDSFLTQIQQNGMSAEYVESLSWLISVPMLIALCISPIVGGTIGALIAKGLLFSDSVKNECLSANPNATNQEIENLLNSFDLLDCIDRHPLTLSGGQRQRLAICQAIMGKKKFLIFGELTSGLDFRHMCQVTEWLKQLAQHGYIQFVVTHDYEFLNRACNCYVRIDKIN